MGTRTPDLELGPLRNAARISAESLVSEPQPSSQLGSRRERNSTGDRNPTNSSSPVNPKISVEPADVLFQHPLGEIVDASQWPNRDDNESRNDSRAGSIRSGRSTPERFQGSSTGFLAPGDLHRRGGEGDDAPLASRRAQSDRDPDEWSHVSRSRRSSAYSVSPEASIIYEKPVRERTTWKDSLGDSLEDAFPDQEIGDEFAQESPIWTTISKQASNRDSDRIEVWDKTLDVHLVFAGLFSAVVTAFLVEYMKRLEPDPAEQQTLLLLELIAVQRGLTGKNLMEESINDFHPSSRNIAINVLWAASLILTLTLAIILMLLKQWVRHSSIELPLEIDRRERIRQFRFNGFSKWRLKTMMTYSPFLLHLALFLFLAGLVLAASPLHSSFYRTSIILTGLFAFLYFVTGSLPAFYADCPYRTPLSLLIFNIKVLSRAVYVWLMTLFRQTKKPTKLRGEYLNSEGAVSTLLQFEATKVEGLSRNEIDMDLLSWLIGSSSKEKQISMVIQALAAMPLQFAYPTRNSIDVNRIRAETLALIHHIKKYLRRLQSASERCPALEPDEGTKLNSVIMHGRSDSAYLEKDNFPIVSLRHIARIVRSVMYLNSRYRVIKGQRDDQGNLTRPFHLHVSELGSLELLAEKLHLSCFLVHSWRFSLNELDDGKDPIADDSQILFSWPPKQILRSLDLPNFMLLWTDLVMNHPRQIHLLARSDQAPQRVQILRDVLYFGAQINDIQPNGWSPQTQTALSWWICLIAFFDDSPKPQQATSDDATLKSWRERLKTIQKGFKHQAPLIRPLHRAVKHIAQTTDAQAIADILTIYGNISRLATPVLQDEEEEEEKVDDPKDNDQEGPFLDTITDLLQALVKTDDSYTKNSPLSPLQDVLFGSLKLARLLRARGRLVNKTWFLRWTIDLISSFRKPDGTNEDTWVNQKERRQLWISIAASLPGHMEHIFKAFSTGELITLVAQFRRDWEVLGPELSCRLAIPLAELVVKVESTPFVDTPTDAPPPMEHGNTVRLSYELKHRIFGDRNTTRWSLIGEQLRKHPRNVYRGPIVKELQKLAEDTPIGQGWTIEAKEKIKRLT